VKNRVFTCLAPQTVWLVCLHLFLHSIPSSLIFVSSTGEHFIFSDILILLRWRNIELRRTLLAGCGGQSLGSAQRAAFVKAKESHWRLLSNATFVTNIFKN
jgi:hypothetical protein